MNFSSLKEYFYKLTNRCYLLVLLPLLIFIFLYFQLQSKKIIPLVQNEQDVISILIGCAIACALNLTTVHWLARKRLTLYATETGLGNKLDRYAEIIMLKMGGGSASSLLMAVGLLLTGHEFFSLLFILILIWILLQWPSSKKACKDLRLKGDEYEMVLYKKDKF
jgi:hypothetical protein